MSKEMENKFAYVCVYGSSEKVSKVVDVSDIFRLSDDNATRYPFDPKKQKDARHFLKDGNQLKRVHVFFTTDTKKNMNEKLKQMKDAGSRMPCPPRRSIGAVSFPVGQTVLAEPKVNKQGKAPLKKSTPNDHKEATNSQKSKQYATILEKFERKCPTKIKPPVGHSTPKKSSGELKEQATPTKTMSTIPNSSIIKSSASKRGFEFPLRTSPRKRNKMETADKSSQTEEDESVKEISDLRKRLREAEAEKATLQTMQDNLQKLCDAMLSQNNNCSKRPSSKCSISSLKSLVEEVPNEVPEDMVYAGPDKFISKQRMAKVDLLKTYEARLSAVLHDILEEPSKFSLQKLDPIQFQAICSYLKSLNWKKMSLKPIKIGKKQYEPLSEEYVRRTISKFFSKAKCMLDSKGNEKIVTKKKMKVLKKGFKKNSISSSEDEEDLQAKDESDKDKGEGDDKEEEGDCDDDKEEEGDCDDDKEQEDGGNDDKVLGETDDYSEKGKDCDEDEEDMSIHLLDTSYD